jgi:hypothetical protein
MPAIFSDELTKAVRQVVKQHLNAFQPRPRKGRRVRASQSSAPPPQQTNDDLRAVSYTTITKATGTLHGTITPGTGTAKLYTEPTSGAPGAGWTLPAGATPVTCENWMFADVVANKPILLRKGRVADNQVQIYTVVAEGCAKVTGG